MNLSTYSPVLFCSLVLILKNLTYDEIYKEFIFYIFPDIINFLYRISYLFYSSICSMNYPIYFLIEKKNKEILIFILALFSINKLKLHNIYKNHKINIELQGTLT